MNFTNRNCRSPQNWNLWRCLANRIKQADYGYISRNAEYIRRDGFPTTVIFPEMKNISVGVSSRLNISKNTECICRDRRSRRSLICRVPPEFPLFRQSFLALALILD